MFKLTDKNMKKSAKLWMVILFLFTGAGRVTAQIPSTRIYDGKKLAKVKARMESKEYASAITKLMNEADKALKSKPVSVMDKTMVAGSGDKHDYVSMGPYWWPDPTKPDGLPYIRKDGVRNPNATSDCTNIGKTINDISTLGIAYYFSSNEKYAAKAAELTRIWFLNPETRMNPNMNYAQMIPGHNENKGRGFGMIDVYAFINLLDAVEMMDTSTAFTTADRSGLKDWFTDYLEWIRTSPVADEARTSENNHGVSFDVQQTVYALFTGDSVLARKTISEFAKLRLFPQIEPDGRQLRELERTNGLSYTNYNLALIMDMCAIGHTLGIDVYNSTSKDGRCIAKALKYMASFIGKPQSEFPYQQSRDWEKELQTSCWILHRASFYDNKSGWEEICQKYLKPSSTDRRRLLYSLE